MDRIWKHSFVTGHSLIDHHHEELFKLTHMVDSALHSHSRDQLEQIVIFLEIYAKDHFSEEENLMQTYHHESYTFHKGEHDTFRFLITKIRDLFNSNSHLTHCVFNLRKLIDRLMIHIQTVDLGIADIVKNHHDSRLT